MSNIFNDEDTKKVKAILREHMQELGYDSHKLRYVTDRCEEGGYDLTIFWERAEHTKEKMSFIGGTIVGAAAAKHRKSLSEVPVLATTAQDMVKLHFGNEKDIVLSLNALTDNRDLKLELRGHNR